MKTMKMALLAGAAIAVSTAAAHADQLQDLKAQVEALNARVAAMETAPSVPTGYQLLAISKGEAAQVPGMLGSDRDRVASDAPPSSPSCRRLTLRPAPRSRGRATSAPRSSIPART